MSEPRSLRVGTPGTLDQFAMESYLRELRMEQSLLFGVAGGVLGALLGAVLWAGATILTDWQIGWMALGVGLLVGLGVRQFGRGIDHRFGIAAGLLAPLGCVFGNLLSGAYIVSAEVGAPFAQVAGALLEEPALALELLGLMFSPLDLVFYAIAVYCGYRFAFRSVTVEDFARFAGRAS